MYIPHTDSDRKDMLQTIGVESLEEMFQDVPAAQRFPKLDLPPALTEMEILDHAVEIVLPDPLAHFDGADV